MSPLHFIYDSLNIEYANNIIDIAITNQAMFIHAEGENVQLKNVTSVPRAIFSIAQSSDQKLQASANPLMNTSIYHLVFGNVGHEQLCLKYLQVFLIGYPR